LKVKSGAQTINEVTHYKLYENSDIISPNC